LTFSLPTVSKSGFKSTVTRMQWADDGKSLLYCNDKEEGIRIIYVQCQPVIPPSTALRFKSTNAQWPNI